MKHIPPIPKMREGEAQRAPGRTHARRRFLCCNRRGTGQASRNETTAEAELQLAAPPTIAAILSNPRPRAIARPTPRPPSPLPSLPACLPLSPPSSPQPLTFTPIPSALVSILVLPPPFGVGISASPSPLCIVLEYFLPLCSGFGAHTVEVHLGLGRSRTCQSFTPR